jgi:2-polyprenyl-6-methoxyphenol hydroxylase-like FAD-dependent oxidoreductase
MRTAVVVGAGIGGLAVAGALARSGWQVTLLEQDDRVRAGRTAVIIWPNGIRALRSLGLGDGLDAIATPLPDTGVRRPDGRWLVPPGGRADERGPVIVHREDLHDALVAGLGDRVEVRTGVRVRDVRATDGERPAVSDGQTFLEADLVVAADGVDSAVRQRLAPQARVVSSGWSAWRAVIPWYRAPKIAAELVSGETLGSGYRFVAASLGAPGSGGGSGRRGIYWVATAAGAPRPEAPATQLALLRRWFADWPAPISELLAATQPDDLVQEEVRELRPLPRAFAYPSGTGGVVLLGDAAHAMPHHLGQGACLALEDAATLRSVVRDAAPGAELRTAVGTYHRLRHPRTRVVVRQVRRMSAALQSRGRLALRARYAALGMITPRLLGRAVTEAAEWHPPE